MLSQDQHSEVLSEPRAQPAGSDRLQHMGGPVESELVIYSPAKLLCAAGRITPEQLSAVQDKAKEDPRLSDLEWLVRNGTIDPITALQALAEYFDMPFRRILPPDVNTEAMDILPMEYLRQKKILPMGWEEDILVVATGHPVDIFLRDDLYNRLHMPLKLVCSPPEDIQKAIEELSAGPMQHVEEIVRDFDEDSVEIADEEAEEFEDLEAIAGESPVIRYVNYVISSAVKEGASDIHIEPGEKHLRVRYRMDGVLFEQPSPSIHMHSAIVSRLKIMANLDIAERRLPQDGRIRATVHHQSVDLRVSTLPTVHGEKCVIRILDNRSISVGLENLGMNPHTLTGWKEEILQPHGIVLVTGPTGSGKSTTLYSSLRIMDSERLNISTVEDPVEYELASINQVNVHDSIGMSFAAALRSLLRQDPDIVMVGEIRDAETARIAVQASLTGHLVLSTLHTNDAPSSITRLINIGVEPFLISASVNAVLAQRLVRKICPECKAEITNPGDREKVYLDKHGIELSTFYRGEGCEKCRQTGYKGRVGVYELFVLDDEARDLISSSPSVTELRRYALGHGMRNLAEDGLEKVASGITSVEEIMRVTETG